MNGNVTARKRRPNARRTPDDQGVSAHQPDINAARQPLGHTLVDTQLEATGQAGNADDVEDNGEAGVANASLFADADDVHSPEEESVVATKESLEPELVNGSDSGNSFDNAKSDNGLCLNAIVLTLHRQLPGLSAAPVANQRLVGGV